MKTIKITFIDTSVYYMLVFENEPINTLIEALEKQKNIKIDYYEEVVK